MLIQNIAADDNSWLHFSAEVIDAFIINKYLQNLSAVRGQTASEAQRRSGGSSAPERAFANELRVVRVFMFQNRQSVRQQFVRRQKFPFLLHMLPSENIV